MKIKLDNWQTAKTVRISDEGDYFTGKNVETALQELGANDSETVVGPASSTDNHVARFDGTTGKLIQDSTVAIDDSGNINLAGTGNIRNGIDGDISLRVNDGLSTSDVLKVVGSTQKVQLPQENSAGFVKTDASGNLTGGQSISASDITDFDTEVSNNSDVSANTSARHDAVTVTDSGEIDFTLTGQDITASIKNGSIDETKLDTSVNASLDLADSATQPGDLATVATSGDHTDLSNIGGYTHTEIDEHIDDTNNPHGVTKTQVGLSNVPDLDTTDAVSKAHDALTLGSNAGSALSLINQQLSLGDIFVRNSGGDQMDGNYNITEALSVSGNLSVLAGDVYGSGTGDDTRVATTSYVKSRGMNLMTNGLGLMLNNYNFNAGTSVTFDQSDLYAGFGSFQAVNRGGVVTKEYISIDPNLYFVGSAWLKTMNLDTSNKAYFGIECSDVDRNLIAPYYTMAHPGSALTTLAADLEYGDTVMELTDATGWYTGATAYLRQALFFGYQNSYGYTYPDYTYSRNSTYNPTFTSPINYRTAGFWATTGISGNTITLTTPWPGDTIPAGTAVQNGSSGGTYKYSFGSNVTIPQDWTQLTGIVGGIDTSKANDPYKFHPGTAFIRLVWLVNYPTEDDNVMNISAAYFSEVNQQNLLKDEAEYTGASNLDLYKTQHKLNSSTAFSLYIPDSYYQYQEITLRNVNTGTVTLTGNFASTVTTSMTAGSKQTLTWDDTDGEWQ